MAYGNKLNLEEHLAKARHNWAFLTQIEGTGLREFRDWSTIVLSYSALHLMDALLHANGRAHGESHQGRTTALTRLVRDRRMARRSLDSYLHLALRSRSLRYSELPPRDQELQELIIDYFRRVEAEVIERLGLEPLPAFHFER